MQLVLIITEQEMSMCMQTKPTENTGYGCLLFSFSKSYFSSTVDRNLRYTFRMTKRQAGPFLKILS